MNKKIQCDLCGEKRNKQHFFKHLFKFDDFENYCVECVLSTIRDNATVAKYTHMLSNYDDEELLKIDKQIEIDKNNTELIKLISDIEELYKTYIKVNLLTDEIENVLNKYLDI